MCSVAEKPWFTVSSVEELRNLLDAGKIGFPMILFPRLSDWNGDIDGEKMRFVQDESSLEANLKECLGESPRGEVSCH